MIPSERHWRVRVREAFRRYHMEVRHLIVLVGILIAFQVVALFLNQRSLHSTFGSAQHWYQQDAAERIANLTATSLELLLESVRANKPMGDVQRQKFIQDCNIVFSQQLLDKNVQTVSILIPHGHSVAVMRDGQQVYDFLFGGSPSAMPDTADEEALRMFRTVRATLEAHEQTYSIVEGQHTFHVFVPFVPNGESIGAVYMRSSPDLSFLARQMSADYEQTALIYSLLIIVGLVAVFLISTRTLAERNEAQRLLFEEQKKFLAEQIHYQKEAMFAKRIYHAHHKAEKISGFVKEDLRRMTPETMTTLRSRIDKYTSFVGRVIYDMKWYDPPVQTIRGPLFRTDINGVIRFLVDNVFQRELQDGSRSTFDLHLDGSIPAVAVNEYVVWEVLEPVIQNAFDHARSDKLRVRINTCYRPEAGITLLAIEDNGHGISPDLLERNGSGVQRLFLESVGSGSQNGKEHSGYGCYIAHELATGRLGWGMSAENLSGGGCRIAFTIPHNHHVEAGGGQ